MICYNAATEREHSTVCVRQFKQNDDIKYMFTIYMYVYFLFI